MKKSLFGLLFLINYLSAQSVWQGRVGKLPVFMQLECGITGLKENSEKCYGGEYFYTSSLQSITLNGEYNASTKSLELHVGYTDRIDETFALKYQNKRLTGTWENKKKKLNVELSLLPMVKNIDEVRAKLLKFKRLKVEKLPHKKELVWIEEQFSENKFFRLGNGFSKQSRTTINPLLDALQKEYANGELACFNIWEYGSGIDSFYVELNYLSSTLLGYQIKQVYDCSGPHPDFNTVRYVQNIQSGKVYALEDILTIARSPEKIRALAFEQAKMKLEPSHEREENGFYDPYELSHWEYPRWDLYEDGIRFYLRFCSAERCFRGDYYEISFERLKPYLSKEFLALVDGKDIFIKE